MANNTGILSREDILENLPYAYDGMIGKKVPLSERMFFGNDVLEAMSQYAQQFAEWLYSKAYNSYDSNGKNCGWLLHDGMDGNIYTTEQLYEIFDKQTNQ
jgi:hypothetical protein